MAWHSFSDFLVMGGHGVYVWGALALVILALMVESVGLRRSRQRLLRQLVRRYHAEAARSLRDHS